jgi:hypothetical protein
VKRSGRDEPIQVVIHLFMEAMLGISLAKMLCLSYYCLCFLFKKIEEEGRTGLPRRKGHEGETEGTRGKR